VPSARAGASRIGCDACVGENDREWRRAEEPGSFLRPRDRIGGVRALGRRRRGRCWVIVARRRHGLARAETQARGRSGERFMRRAVDQVADDGDAGGLDARDRVVDGVRTGSWLPRLRTSGRVSRGSEHREVDAPACGGHERCRIPASRRRSARRGNAGIFALKNDRPGQQIGGALVSVSAGRQRPRGGHRPGAWSPAKNQRKKGESAKKAAAHDRDNVA